MLYLSLVEVARDGIDAASFTGFVVGQGADLLVLHRVSDRYDLDGYVAVRRQDVTSINGFFKRRDLVERALRLKNLAPQPLDFPLTSVADLMNAAQAAYGVLVLHREKVNAEEVQVGIVRISSSDTYVLRWLSTTAEWGNDDRQFRYSDVSMIEFGAEYDQTLLSVARDRQNVGSPSIPADRLQQPLN